MKWPSFLATVAALLAPIHDARGQSSRAQPGDAYALTLTRDMAQRDNRGGVSSSHDRDTLIERVVEARADRLVLDYDLPRATTAQERAVEWHFPARVLKPGAGPVQLLNGAELEARIDPWLQGGGMTRAHCGQLIFTWNAFRIDCDPQSVTKMVQRFDLTSFEAREGASYTTPDAAGPAPLKRGALGRTLIAELAVDPEAVRRARAETDVGVAYFLKKPLTLEDALRERAKDTVSGTITVTFELSAHDGVSRRTTVARLETRRPDGRVETQTTTETLERRRLSPR